MAGDDDDDDGDENMRENIPEIELLMNTVDKKYSN